MEADEHYKRIRTLVIINRKNKEKNEGKREA